MLKKFVAWVKALFSPAKIEIEDVKVDEYIAKQAQSAKEVRFTKAEDRPLSQPLAKNEVLVSVDTEKETARVVTVEIRNPPEKAPATPPKPLNEQFEGVELPAYAQGRKLPPKAKRQYIERAKTRPLVPTTRRVDDSPATTGSHVSTVGHGSDAATMAVLGYTAASVMNNDSTPAPAECRSAAAISTYSSSYSSSDDSSSYHSSSSSSSSYDSGSYDSGSSYSSCD